MGLLKRIAASVSVKSPADAPPVLLVEDNPDEARALAQALERAGFPVICTASVAEALANVEARGKLLAAIVDMKLPDASGGLVVWKLRRRFLAELPIAVVTGMSNPESDYNLSRHPPDRLFPKPLDIDRLLDWIRAVQSAGERGQQ